MPNWRTGKGVISALQIGEGNKPWRMSLKFLADDAPQGAVAENMTVKAWGRDAEPLAIAEGGPCAVTIEEKPAEGNYPAEWFIKAWNGKDVRQQARSGGSSFKGGGGGGPRPRDPAEGASIVAQVIVKEAAEMCRAEMTLGVHAEEGQPQVFNPNRFRQMALDIARAYHEVTAVVLPK